MHEQRLQDLPSYEAGTYQVIVVGAGHAGIEAALACARLGLSTLCFTINLDAVGNMPCNPAIGGAPARATWSGSWTPWGGEMARAADRACIQYRVLNRGKGPAVHSLRAQADRREYQKIMKHTLETQENLWVKQGEVTRLLTEAGHVTGVQTDTGAIYRAQAVVICSGTYLGGKTIIGQVAKWSGPDGMFGANALTESLRQAGLTLRRFKTGTPPRVNARSIDFSQLERQEGDGDAEPFSFTTEAIAPNRVCCYITYTNEKTPRNHPGQPGPLPPLLRGDPGGGGPGTAPPSRTRWSALPTSPGTSSSWSPWGWTPRRSTSRASPPPSRRTCSFRCSTPSRGWCGRR